MTPGPGSMGLGEGAKRGDLNEEKPLGRWRLKGWEVWRASRRAESLQLTSGAASSHSPAPPLLGTLLGVRGSDQFGDASKAG